MAAPQDRSGPGQLGLRGRSRRRRQIDEPDPAPGHRAAAAARAWSRSSSRSSGSSRPIDSRATPGVTPISARSSSVSRECVVVDGWQTSDLASPRLFEMSISDSASKNRKASALPPGSRSEEHPSELQSLMRTSYAVFCLKKKTTTDKENTK